MPITSTEDKLAIISDLQSVRDKAALKFLPLMLAGRVDDARKIRSKTRKLTEQIDHLLGLAMDGWVGDSGSVIDEIRKANDRILEAIREIDDNLDNAENIAKLIRHLERVIIVAVKLAATAG